MNQDKLKSENRKGSDRRQRAERRSGQSEAGWTGAERREAAERRQGERRRHD